MTRITRLVSIVPRRNGVIKNIQFDFLVFVQGRKTHSNTIFVIFNGKPLWTFCNFPWETLSDIMFNTTYIWATKTNKRVYIHQLIFVYVKIISAQDSIPFFSKQVNITKSQTKEAGLLSENKFQSGLMKLKIKKIYLTWRNCKFNLSTFKYWIICNNVHKEFIYKE